MSTPDDPIPSPDEPEAPPPAGASRSPREYRPDLRPMLILAGLLVLVFAAWLFLGPMILPPAR